MNRFRKRLLIVGIVILLLLAVALAVVLNSGVQTSFARSFLQKMDPTAQIERVSLGFGGGEILGLDMKTGGGTLKADTVAIQFSLWNILFGNPKVIDDLQLKGIVFDTTKPAAESKSVDGASGSGSKEGSTRLVVKKANITGKLLLPGQRVTEFSLEAHDFGASSTGQANGTVSFADPAADARVREMRADANLSVTCDRTMFPESINLTANLSALVAGQAQPSKLVAHLEAKPQSGSGGTVSFNLSEPGSNALALFAIKGSYDAAGVFKGTYSIDASRARVEPFALGYALPDFDLVGSGDLQADTAKHEASAKGKLQGTVGRLGVLRANLEPIGSVKLSADFDVAWAKDAIEGRTLTATLAPATGATAVSLALIKPVIVEFSGKAVQITKGSGPELLRVTLADAPAGWFTPFVPESFQLGGRAITGEIVAGSREDGAIVARTTKPLAASGLSLAKHKDALFGGGYVEIDATAVYVPANDGAKIQAEVRRLLCSADTISVPGGVLKLSTQTGAIATLQYAGNVTATLSSGPVQFGGSGRLAAAVEIDRADRAALGAELPAISPNGRLLLDASFDIARGANTYDITALQANLTKGQTVLASAKVLQKFSVPLSANGSVSLPSMSGNVAELSVTGLPLALAQPVLGKARKIGGVADRGRILVTGAASGGAGLDVRTDQQISVSNLQFSENGTTKLSGVTLTLTPAATVRGGNLTAEGHLEAVVPAGRIIAGTFELAQSPTQWSANIAADGRFGAMASQPFAVEWRDALADPKPEYTLAIHAVGTADNLTVDVATVRIMPAGGVGAAIGDLHIMQPVKVDIGPDGKYGWPKLSGDVAAIKLLNVPAGVLSLGLPGFKLEGRGITGNLVVRGAGDGSYTATSDVPVAASNLTVTKTGGDQPAPWLRDLTFTIRPEVKLNQGGLTYFNGTGIDLSSAGQQIGQGDLEMTFVPERPWWGQAKAALKVDLALLLTQPILSKFNNLDHGTLQLQGETAPDGSVRLNAQAASWQVRSPKTDLRQFSFSNVVGKIDHESGGLQLTVPISGQSPAGTTECSMTVTLGPTAPAPKAGAPAVPRSFSFSLTGNTLVVDDLMGIAAAFRPPPAAAIAGGPVTATVAIAPNSADKEAFWGAMQGRAQVQLQKLIFHGLALQAAQMTAEVTPTTITVPAISARFEAAPLSASGSLAFDGANAARPYNLNAKIALQDFDAGLYFRTRDPKAKPPAEGKFTITGSAGGRGASLADLQARVPFEFNLGSSGGVFHVLDLVKNKNAAAGAALTIGSGLAGIAAGLIGQAAPKVGQGIGVFNELVTSLEAVTYTSLVLVAKRGDDGNITMSQFEVKNNVLQLVGSGSIAYAAGKAIPDEPLTATLQLNATGRPAQIMGGVGLMESANSQGYQQGPRFQVTGTLQSMNYDSLYSLLFRAVVGGVTQMIK